jgi:plasmid stability protein
MTAITVREVPPETVKALKLRAVQAGQSLSDEPDACEYAEDGGTRLVGKPR